MVHARNKIVMQFALLAALLSFSSREVFAQQDPPSRVARLSYINGNVSMEPAGVDEWAPAEVNRPFTIGDYLYADQGGEAELDLDVGVIRIGSQTSFGFLNLDDRTVQLKLTEGDMYVRVHDFASDQVFEVDTPNAAITLLGDGIYRFRVDANGSMSFVVVRQGQAQITGGGQAFTLNADNSATLTGTDQLAYDIELAPQPDEFDQWCQERDAHEAQVASRRYLPPTVIGSEDLGDYGVWQENPQYGAVWYPQNVDPGWAPYHYGHWAWIDPWGWTWVDSMPWGFAPFHYGRWAYIGNRWGWCPGPIAVGNPGPVIRPYYAPAMVAWFGGAHWGVGISVGGPSLGWVPLGWGEVYTPSYHCSPAYFNNVNVYNTRIVKTVNITNVYNNVYVNKQVYNQQFVNVRAPNAVMAMPQSAFVSGRSVRQAGTPVRQADFARLQTAAVVAPPVAPTRQSFAPTATGRPVPRPAAQVVQRQVVARNTPPPAPAPFAERQQYLQQHAGQPVNPQAMRQAVPSAHPVVANVRQAPPAKPVAVRPGERVGNSAAFNRPAAPAPRPAPAAQNGRIAEPAAQQNRPGQPVSQQNGRIAEPPLGNRPAVENRAGPQPAPVRAAQPQNGSVPQQQPPANLHGVPPNMRQGTTQPAQNGRFAEGTRPGSAPANRNQPAPQPGVQERTQPAPERVPPATRQQPQVPERSQPQPVRQQPQVQEGSQPQPERAPVPSRPSPNVQERTQPAPERVPPATRQQPQVPERSQPTPERVPPPTRQQPPVQERSQPQPTRQPPPVQERSQPAPQERRGYPERNSPPEERSQPNRQESKPAPRENSHPAPQGDHSKSDKTDKKGR